MPVLRLLAAPRPCRRMHSKVHGLFINYIDHRRPHLFARPTPSTNSSTPIVDATLDFLPDDHHLLWWWSVLDHSDGLLLCEMGSGELCVCNPATRRWTLLPWPQPQIGGGTYVAFDPFASPHYEVVVIPAASPPFVHDDRSRRLMESEWPPSPWSLDVFSSRTDRWEKRAFVRHGEPAGTIRDMLPYSAEPEWGPCQRYAVYCQGALYVHCRGSFICRYVNALSH
jgi:hypothetical protein